MDYTLDINKKIDEVRTEFAKSQEYNCTFPFASREIDIFLSQVLRGILIEIDKETLHSHLEYALNEMVMNASKANTKRVYFMACELDINDPAQYKKGMKRFKENVFGNFSRYESAHIDNEIFVHVKLSIQDSILKLEVTNNSPLLQEEKVRIAERLKIARKFNNLAEVLTHGFDTTEGAGYGLIVIMLMLRKINLDEKSLIYQSDENTSKTTISIPLNLISKDHGTIIAEEIINEMEMMPQFPESITLLQKELSDPNCTFETIADTINSDPALATEIIRIANSPVYRVPNKISDVAGAVRLIGMLGVKSILYNFGANQVFNTRYNKKMIKELNEHSFYVALIASYLAQYKGLSRLGEDIYVASLLHDFGKIVVNSLNKDISRKLQSLCLNKHIPISILDDLTEGYNHALIGAALAQKWDFPAKYVNAIQYHHLPLEVEEEFKVVTYAVYLGNELYYHSKGERELDDINYMVLQFFGLEQQDVFERFIEALENEGLGA